MKETTKEVLTEEQQILVLENIKLVPYVLKREYTWCSPNTDTYEEMYQDGCLALCLAAVRFDPSYQIKFSSYAYIYIKTYILHGIYSRSGNYISPCTVDKRTLIDFTKINKLKKQYPDISDEEIMKACDLSYERLNFAINLTNYLSFDITIPNADNASFAEVIADNSIHISESIESQELYNDIMKCLTKLRYTIPYHKELFNEVLSNRLKGISITQNEYATKYHISRTQFNNVMSRYTKLLKEELKHLYKTSETVY